MLKKEKELGNILNALQRAVVGNHQRAVKSQNKVEKSKKCAAQIGGRKSI